MKIAIPLDEKKENVCVSFGRAPYFMFFDMDSKKSEIVENPAANAEGGAGPKAAQFVLDNGAEAVITVRCGENAGKVFQVAGTKVYKSSVENAEKNISEFLNGKLSELDHFHAGFMGRA